MASSRSQKRPEIAVVSLGHHTESYPNTFYKTRLLIDRYGKDVLPIIHGLSKSESVSGLRNLKAAIVFRFTMNNMRALLTLARTKPAAIYICYPGVLLACLCRFIPGNYRPRIHLDAFISIYDTVIVDRKLADERSVLAKLLRRVEALAYRNCETVIVDTAENAGYLAGVFGIPEQKLRVINLTSPPIDRSAPVPRTSARTCLFIGTFVPLQGIECIAHAAQLLRHRTDIHFRIIGDGQDGRRLREIMTHNAATNISWLREWHSTAQLEREIAEADICLGIFGTTAKAERVWPFKNYLYMAAGKPLITGDSRHARRLQKMSDAPAFVTCTLGSPSDLADAIARLLDAPQVRVELGNAARAFYEEHLSHAAALRSLETLLASTGAA